MLSSQRQHLQKNINKKHFQRLFKTTCYVSAKLGCNMTSNRKQKTSHRVILFTKKIKNIISCQRCVLQDVKLKQVSCFLATFCRVFITMTFIVLRHRHVNQTCPRSPDRFIRYRSVPTSVMPEPLI